MCLHLPSATGQAEGRWITEKNEMWFLFFMELLPLYTSAVITKDF